MEYDLHKFLDMLSSKNPMKSNQTQQLNSRLKIRTGKDHFILVDFV